MCAASGDSRTIGEGGGTAAGGGVVGEAGGAGSGKAYGDSGGWSGGIEGWSDWDDGRGSKWMPWSPRVMSPFERSAL